MKKQDFRFFYPLRARWAEVDMQKIVFNAHYLMYFDTAMAEYWRALALPYEEAMHQLGGDLYVKKASLEYAGSARFDDQLSIGLKCVRVGRSSIEFVGAVFRADSVLVTGELIYVFANPLTQSSQPVPDALRGLLTGYELGQGSYTLSEGAWAELGPGAAQLRVEVFVHEQGVPLEMECDAADADAVHAVARNHLGQVLATGRLLAPAPGVGKIGRMAVKRVMRGSGLGRDLLDTLSAAAARRGDQEIVLHAQRSAEGFYQRAGFICRGEPFDEADIPHIEMFKRLV
jgi:YbgC/YbaW family acyl-CoA thioester hydrolase